MAKSNNNMSKEKASALYKAIANSNAQMIKKKPSDKKKK